MELSSLSPPGLIVNLLKGDPAERRVNAWLEGGVSPDLDAALFGVPFDGASTVRPGARHAPDAVRQALSYYTTYSSETGFDMSGMQAADIGDVSVVVTDMRTTFARVAATARELVEGGISFACIGGDHSITWPLLEGVTTALDGKHLGVVHFDAHHDLREAHFGAESSGVPFRKALEFPGSPILGRNLVQIGMTEFCNSSVHAEYAREQGVTVIPALSVRRDGIESVVDRAIEAASNGTQALYVSVDVDAIDQSQAPGTAAPNPAGLDARDVQYALRRLGEHPRTIALDVVVFSPPLDINHMTANLGAMLVLCFLMGLASRRG